MLMQCHMPESCFFDATPSGRQWSQSCAETISLLCKRNMGNRSDKDLHLNIEFPNSYNKHPLVIRKLVYACYLPFFKFSAVSESRMILLFVQ